MADESLTISSAEQYRTAQELIERSRPNATYFILLAISSVIIAAGLLLDNGPITIGGMLVAPVLTPLLSIGLGLSIGEMGIMRRTSLLLVESVVIIIASSYLMAIVLGAGSSTFTFENSTRVAILYFIVALASGAAATFAWTHKNLSDVLPGISIAVSLVPPLSLIGIWLSVLDVNAARFYFSVFLLNLFGIVIGSLVVFSLLRFYESGERIHKKVMTEAAAAAAPPKDKDKEKEKDKEKQ